MADKIYKNGNCVVFIMNGTRANVPVTDLYFKEDVQGKFLVLGAITKQIVYVPKLDLDKIETEDPLINWTEETFFNFLCENSLLNT